MLAGTGAASHRDRYVQLSDKDFSSSTRRLDSVKGLETGSAATQWWAHEPEEGTFIMFMKLRRVMKKALMFHYPSDVDAYSIEDKGERDRVYPKNNEYSFIMHNLGEAVRISAVEPSVMMAPAMQFS